MSYVLLDTDVASLSFKRRLPPGLLVRLHGHQPCLSFVTLAELTQWTELRHWGTQRRTALSEWLSHAVVLPYADEIAHTWGRVSAAAIQRGRRRPANDTWIAACALAYGIPLATLNLKDFVDFSEHHGLKIVSNG